MDFSFLLAHVLQLHLQTFHVIFFSFSTSKQHVCRPQRTFCWWHVFVRVVSHGPRCYEHSLIGLFYHIASHVSTLYNFDELELFPPLHNDPQMYSLSVPNPHLPVLSPSFQGTIVYHVSCFCWFDDGVASLLWYFSSLNLVLGSTVCKIKMEDWNFFSVMSCKIAPKTEKHSVAMRQQ